MCKTFTTFLEYRFIDICYLWQMLSLTTDMNYKLRCATWRTSAVRSLLDHHEHTSGEKEVSFGVYSIMCYCWYIRLAWQEV